MYYEKMNEILECVEDKNVEIAGGSVVGIVLSTINSLIKYICNLTINKKNYEDVEDKVKNLLILANELKNKTLNVIDEDKRVLEEILITYKNRKEDIDSYNTACKKSVEFCEYVLNLAYETLKLSHEISLIGNKMLSSDFKICKYYSYASIKSSIVNVNINLDSINDDEYKNEVKNRCDKVLKDAEEYMKGLI